MAHDYPQCHIAASNINKNNCSLGCSTVWIQHIHKYKIPSGGSQIDGLEAGKITNEDPSLLVVRKFVKPTFAHQIRW